MKKLAVIGINKFQLNALLNSEQKEEYTYLLKHGVYCRSCEDICSKGVDVKEMYLTELNDIKIVGTCKECAESVTRIMEFGGDEEFYMDANDFRRNIKS